MSALHRVHLLRPWVGQNTDRRYIAVGRLALVVCIGLVLVGGLSAARAQAASHADSLALPDSARATHPNAVPYESGRSVIAHVLAVPSYLLHYATRPIGWGMVWVEEHFPSLFRGERPPYGAYPIIELGGPVGVQGGLVAFHQNLFGRGHRARIEGTIGGRDYRSFGGSYVVPQLGASTRLAVNGRYVRDPLRRFFIGGNASGRAAETRFTLRQAGADIRLDARRAARVRSRLDLSYQHIETVRPSPDALAGDEPDDRYTPIPAGMPGLGTADRLGAHLSVTFDRARGARRIQQGTRLRLGAGYTHEFGTDRSRYSRYLVEVQHFIPLPVLPASRRLALRAQWQQVIAWNDRPVPFYALPTLGGPETLRGFVANRFSENGALLLTAEYRYPIWSNLDAVLFVDAGQVVDAPADIGIQRFHVDGGGGLHLLSSQGISIRMEVAFSAEGTRALLTFEPLF